MRKPIRRVKTPAKKARTNTSKSKKSSRKSSTPKQSFDRGATGFARAKKKQQRQQEDYDRKKETPFDFRIKPGDEAEVIILDKGEPFFVSLHKVKNAQGRWEDAVCIEDSGQRCPLCEDTGKSGSYTMMLTILDRRPYKIQNGPNAGKTIKVSKKLMGVKGKNLPKFERQYNGKAKENFRGVKVHCRRDGDKEAAIGEDLEFLGRIKESALTKFGENAEVANYEKIFEMPTADELRKRYNLGRAGKVAGSEEFDNDDDDANLDNVGW